jgi:hypothetical protein
MKVKKGKTFSSPTFGERVKWYFRKKELTTDDVCMLFAIRDGYWKAYYQKHYNDMVDPSIQLMMLIVEPIISKVPELWQDVVRATNDSRTIIEITEEKTTLQFREWLWHGLIAALVYKTIYFYDEHAPSDWEHKLDCDRDEYVTDSNGKTWIREKVMVRCLEDNEKLHVKEGDVFDTILKEDSVDGLRYCTVVEEGKSQLMGQAIPLYMLEFYYDDIVIVN